MLFTKPTHKMKKVIYLLVVPVVLISCLAFAKLKSGEAEPDKCRVCDYCKETKVITKPITTADLLEGIY